jgi:hypothetical protein
MNVESVSLPRLLLLKLNLASPIFDTIEERKALSLAIDRAGLAQAVLRYPAAATQVQARQSHPSFSPADRSRRLESWPCPTLRPAGQRRPLMNSREYSAKQTPGNNSGTEAYFRDGTSSDGGPQRSQPGFVLPTLVDALNGCKPESSSGLDEPATRHSVHRPTSMYRHLSERVLFWPALRRPDESTVWSDDRSIRY